MNRVSQVRHSCISMATAITLVEPIPIPSLGSSKAKCAHMFSYSLSSKMQNMITYTHIRPCVETHTRYGYTN